MTMVGWVDVRVIDWSNLRYWRDISTSSSNWAFLFNASCGYHHSHFLCLVKSDAVAKFSSSLTHWGLTLLAEQRPRTFNSLQCSFPWRGWRRGIMLATNATFEHSYYHQNWLFYLNIYDFMISECYL